MARSRSIKPGFFKNENLAECGPHAMLLFAGLWTLADREGRLEDRPKRIRAEVFPYFDDVNIESILTSLASSGFIVRYEVSGFRYIAIPTWDKHQNPHVKEAVSTIPAPGEHDTSPVQAPEIPERAGLTPSFLTPSSLTVGDGARASVLEFPKVDYHARYEVIYTNHPVPGFKAEGQLRYLEIVGQSVNPETVADAIDRDHTAWLKFWEEHPAEFRPGIGKYFEDGWYVRKPAARARDSPGSRLTPAQAALKRIREQGEAHA